MKFCLDITFSAMGYHNNKYCKWLPFASKWHWTRYFIIENVADNTYRITERLTMNFSPFSLWHYIWHKTKLSFLKISLKYYYFCSKLNLVQIEVGQSIFDWICVLRHWLRIQNMLNMLICTITTLILLKQFMNNQYASQNI